MLINLFSVTVCFVNHLFLFDNDMFLKKKKYKNVFEFYCNEYDIKTKQYFCSQS